MSAPLLGQVRLRVYFDGIWSEPRLTHPEGVTVGPDGWVWCGNQDGEICRIAPDGSRIERVAGTGGFLLVLAFDGDRALFACDLKHAAVFRLDLATGTLERLEAPGLRIPNFPVVDRRRGRLHLRQRARHAAGRGSALRLRDLCPACLSRSDIGAPPLWKVTA